MEETPGLGHGVTEHSCEGRNLLLFNGTVENGKRQARIIGNDGSIKIQMRLSLGLLQMEATGRPDGLRPHGKESLLDYYEGLLADHILRHGTDEGFSIGAQACHELREEGIQYYHRYLSNFLLEEYAAVVRDTERNLRLLDFVRKYARHEADRNSLEGYRPYILMMNARAKAGLALKAGDFDTALAEIAEGIRRIEIFFSEIDQPELVERSMEVASLRQLEEEIRRRRPADPRQRLREELEEAVLKAPPGSDGLILLPYFEGERTPNVPDGTGVFFGLNSRTFDSAHFARAAMEGVTLGMNYGLNRMKELGIKPSQIRLTGGGSKNKAWRQIAADIFGVETVCLKIDEGAAYGAALQAMWTYKRYNGERVSIQEITDRFIEVDEETLASPRRSNVKLYRELQKIQDELSLSLRKVFSKHRAYLYRFVS